MADGLHLHPAGTGFYRSTDGNSYVLLDNLSSVDGPNLERGVSPDTALASPNRFLIDTPGWIKGDDIPLVMYLHKTQANTLYSDFTAGTTLYWRELFPTITGESAGSKWEFQGWISKYHSTKAEKASEDKVMIEWSIHPTTLPTFTAGS